jgi:hypothetical protein
MNCRLPRSSAVALVAALGVATAAWASEGSDPAAPPRPTATVIADLDAPRAEVARARSAAARAAGLRAQDVPVRRTGGPLEATAQVSALASQHPTAVAAAGSDARAAVGQAEGSELAPATAWLD